MTHAQLLKRMHAPMIIAAFVAILFSTLATAAIVKWFQTSSAGAPVAEEQMPELAAVEHAGHAKQRCEECGVIDSTRWKAALGNSPAGYETTIRMSDGSTHRLSDASPARWRSGEHIILIGGWNPSDK